MTASRYLRLLEHDGWIKTIVKGNPSGKATRFRFIDKKKKRADNGGETAIKATFPTLLCTKYLL